MQAASFGAVCTAQQLPAGVELLLEQPAAEVQPNTGRHNTLQTQASSSQRQLFLCEMGSGWTGASSGPQPA